MPVQNFPGPYEIRLFYSTTPTGFATMQHVARYNINLTSVPPPGSAFSLLTVVARGGVPQTLQTYIDNWVILLKAALSNAANNVIDYAELWQYTPGSFEAQFVSVYPIAVAGTNAGTSTGAAEQIIVYRTQEGGIMRQHFEELASSAGGLPDTPPFANAALEAMRVFTEGTTNAWLGRDTSYPFATIAVYPGQNEAIFKKRFRP